MLMKDQAWTERQPPPDEPVTYSQRQLQALLFGLGQLLSKYVLGAKVDASLDAWSDNIIVSVRGYVWAEKLADEDVPVRFDVPATWWQMLKREYAPAWFLARFPVRTKTLTKTIRYSTYGKFPEYRYEAPPLSGLGPVVFHRTSAELNQQNE